MSPRRSVVARLRSWAALWAVTALSGAVSVAADIFGDGTEVTS